MLELILGVLIFTFYFVPAAQEEMGFLRGPEKALKQAVVRYRDDDDLRDLIDTVQKEVFVIES